MIMRKTILKLAGDGRYTSPVCRELPFLQTGPLCGSFDSVQEGSDDPLEGYGDESVFKGWGN